MVGRSHVHTITYHTRALLRRQQIQARRGCFLVAARHHCQHLRILRITQIGHDRHVQLVAFLQTNLIHADVRNHTLGVDHQRLAVGQLVLHDEAHRLRGDAQSPRHLGLVGADEHPQHLFLEAIGVAGVFAFERRQEVVAVMAFGATMKDGLVAEESGLPKNIEIANDARFANVEIGLDACRLHRFATRTAARFGQGPSDFDAVRIGEAMIAGDGGVFGQIDVDGEVDHGRPWQG